LQCDEGADFRTFRMGLFGLDKLRNVDRTVANLEAAIATIRSEGEPARVAAEA
jgi:aspartate aminotransferase-like enzyme